MTRKEVAQKIDLAVLRPDATESDVLKGCEQAKFWGVKSLVVLPCWLELIVRELEGSEVVPSTVIAFPSERKQQRSKQRRQNGQSKSVPASWTW